ncbi:unnamed protein product, partial [Mesorhabditis spiculigera]
MTTTDDKPYKLSRVIEAHKSDVKCLQSTSSGLLISGGRDETVRFWQKKGGEFTEVSNFPQGANVYVNSLAYYEAQDNNEWRLFVGRKDGVVNVYGPGTTPDKPIHTLILHEQNVSCMSVDQKQGLLLTGSWDKTAMVLSVHDPIEEHQKGIRLVGHTLSVLAVQTLPEEGWFLTAGSDRTVRMWKNDIEKGQFTGHKDVVRALCVLSRERFLSASNDATIILWDITDGSAISKFSSLMDNFIYSLTPQPNGGFVTTSEGGFVEVWKKLEDEEFTFTNDDCIKTPANSIWTACTLPNGDLVTAGSDGKIYIWTRNEKREASATVRETFDAAVAEKTAKEMELAEKQSSETVVIKVSLDDSGSQLELRYQKGSDPSIAAQKFITDNNLPASYLNEITDYIVQNIPEAKAAVAKKYRTQETQRINVDGELWDYAFDVSVDDGRQLRLCYNAGEDMDYAAQRFVEKHNLPMKFLAQVSGLLRREMAGHAPEPAMPVAAVADPFTGGGRYIPGGASSGTEGTADPFTGGGRYVPGSAPATQPTTRHADKTRPKGEFWPISSYYTFGVEQLSQKAKDKLLEINAKQTGFQLNDEQMSSLFDVLSVPPGSLEITDTLTAAIDLAFRWEIQDLLPAVDIFRIALLHEKLNDLYCSPKKRGRETLERLNAIMISDPPDAIRALVCRAIANAFTHDGGREMMMMDVKYTAKLLAQQILHAKPVVQVAAATALANWALLLLQRSLHISELGPREDLIRVIIETFEEEPAFGGRSEVALFRLMQCLVSLMWGDSQVIKTCKNRNLASIVSKLKDSVVEENGKAIARDIVEMINAV